MKNLKTYKMFESSVELTPEQVEWLNRCTRGTTWQMNPRTGEVDVDGHFDCSAQGLRDLKGVRFGVVKGDFHCSDNHLSSLEGSPQEAGRGFFCDRNQLTTLEGAPQKIEWNFSCSNNQLTSLDGAPQVIGGDFYCRENQFTSLEGSPQEVGGSFYCDRNHLTTLEGAPQKVEWNFDCKNNQLTTLDGAPQEVGGNFDCRDNQITSLDGAPQKVGRNYYNQFTSSEGVGRNFYCDKNPVSEGTLKSIFSRMEKDENYIKAVESVWSDVPLDDQILLYRPEFDWVGPDEVKKLDTLRAYQGFKGMI
jgi:hypothetical protein